MNGYTEIKIKDKVIGLKFGMYANRLFSEKQSAGKFYNEDSLNELGIAVLLYCGYENNCLLKEQSTDLTLEDFYDFVEEKIVSEDVGVLKKVVETWTSSTFIKKSIERLKESKEEVKKKKSTGTSLKKPPSGK